MIKQLKFEEREQEVLQNYLKSKGINPNNITKLMTVQYDMAHGRKYLNRKNPDISIITAYNIVM